MDDKQFNLFKNTLLGIVAILLILLALVGIITAVTVNKEGTPASGSNGYAVQAQSGAVNIYKVEEKANYAAPAVQTQYVAAPPAIQQESTRLNVNTRINVHVNSYNPYPYIYPRYRYYAYYTPVPYGFNHPYHVSPNYLVHKGSYNYNYNW